MTAWFKEHKQKIIIGSLAFPPLLVSFISTIHVVTFFLLSNSFTLALILAIAFEIGTLSSLAALTVVKKISQVSLWGIFILLTAIQCTGNTYYAYNYITTSMGTNPYWIKNWVELFGFTDESLDYTKRILSITSGAILPIISLGFTHLLLNYVNSIQPEDTPLPIVKDNPQILTDEDREEIDKILTEGVNKGEAEGEKFIEYKKQ